MTNERQSAGWSLRKGLLLSFGLATLLLYSLAQALLVFGVPFTPFKGLRASQTAEAIANISAMADARKNQLESWVVERRADVRAIADNPLLQEALQAMLRQSSAAGKAEAGVALKRLRGHLQLVVDSYRGEYSRIEIIAANSGQVLVSTRPEEEGRTAALAPHFRKVVNLAVEEVVVNKLDEDGRSTDLVFARAIHGPDDHGSETALAILVLHNTMASITSSFLHEGIGRTGEIVLVDQDARLMAPLRYPLADGSEAQPLVFINPAKSAALAAQGIETVIEAPDYRGVEVLAATRHLRVTSELAWGLVVKIDASEGLQTIRQTLVAHLLALGGALLAGGLMIVLIAIRFTAPLAALSRAAVAIAAGDLSVRTVPEGSRELRDLSRSFNTMVARLEHWHKDLAAEVEKRTAELTAANEALRESEERYRRIVETSGEGIWLTDEGYLALFVNPRMAAMLGYQPQEMVGRPVASFMADEEQTEHQEQMALRKNGQNSRYERRFKRRDGTLLWTLISATPILDEQGKFRGSLAMVSDISEQKRMANALRENQARLDLALRSAGMGVFHWDIATERYTFDDQTCHLLGLDPLTFTGSAEEFLQAVYPDDREAIRAALARIIAQDELSETEYRVRWPDGSAHHLAARGRLIRDGAGQAERVSGVVWDVTASRQAEEERKILLQQLNQAQKMEAIGTLAGGIAHDFNNILAAILGYAELASEDAPPGSSFAHDVEKILVSAHRAKDLVKQILAFGRQSSVDRIPIKVQALIKEALKLLRASIPATIEIKGDIDPQCGPIVADPTQIHQVMMNLCTNAYHAMEKSGGVLRVSLEMVGIAAGDEAMDPPLAAGDYVKLTVADTGAGISPEVMGRIFDPYFTTKEFGKGTGMGLAITHGIVKSHGGGISVQSSLGQGTTFHVYFPVAAGQAPGEEKSETAALPGGREHILFIDDEQLIVEMAQAMLERLGYRVVVRRNSFEALEVFMNNPGQFDLVITDQTMPGMTGSDLARRLLQIRPEVPIILCTGYSNLIDEAAARAMGIKGFAMKPLSKTFLAQLIREVLDGRSTGQP